MGSGSSRRKRSGASGAPGGPGRGAGGGEAARAPTGPPESGGDADWALLEELLAEVREPDPPPSRPAAGGEQPASLTRSTQDPENNSFASELPVRSNKKSEVQSTISYDYSEEELMASIEREYCR